MLSKCFLDAVLDINYGFTLTCKNYIDYALAEIIVSALLSYLSST